MKNSIGEIFVVIFFLVFLFVFGIWTFFKPDISVSELENRKLTQRPDATINNLFSGDYFKRFETYYNDQFPLRNVWIEAKSTFEKNALQKDVINSVYVHDDGYLITPVLPRNDSLSPKTLSNKIKEFAAKNKKYDVEVYFALAPNKTTMMEYKLPNYVKSKGNILSDQLISEFSKNENITAIDLRKTIKPHLNEPNMYFYTDHHWKAKAAFYAYTAIIEKIKENNDIKDPIPKESFSWDESNSTFYGSDARKTTATYAEIPDTVTIAKPKFKEKDIKICFRGSCDNDFYDLKYLKEDDKYTNRYGVYMSGDFPEGVISNPNVENGHNLLILKDSYANAMIQFLARNFDETRILDLRHFNKGSVLDYIEKHKIDEVLFIHNINSLILTPALTNFKG